MRREIRALQAAGEFEVLLNSYPFVYERAAEGKKLFIAINPSQYTHRYDAPKLGKILMSQNVEPNGQQLVMKGVSFIIAQEA